MYTIQILSCFVWALNHSHDHTSLYYPLPKKLYYPLLPNKEKQWKFNLQIWRMNVQLQHNRSYDIVVDMNLKFSSIEGDILFIFMEWVFHILGNGWNFEKNGSPPFLIVLSFSLSPLYKGNFPTILLNI